MKARLLFCVILATWTAMAPGDEIQCAIDLSRCKRELRTSQAEILALQERVKALLGEQDRLWQLCLDNGIDPRPVTQTIIEADDGEASEEAVTEHRRAQRAFELLWRQCRGNIAIVNDMFVYASPAAQQPLMSERYQVGDYGLIRFRVIDVLNNRSLLAQRGDRVIHVTGVNTRPVTDGSTYNSLAVVVGQYEYVTVLGGRSRVPSLSVFSWGVDDKQEFLDALNQIPLPRELRVWEPFRGIYLSLDDLYGDN